MRMESGKLSGIVNGIDTDLLDPETDVTFLITSQWMICQVKPKTRQLFKNRVGLPVREDVPLIGIVSRLD